MGIVLPLDKICLKSGILCDNCQRKVDEGRVGVEELDVLKALAEAETGLKGFEGRYVKTIKHGDALIVLLETRSHIPRKLRRELESRLKGHGRVIVAKYSKDLIETVNSLIEPLRVVGADEIYAPDGSTYKVLKIEKRGEQLLGGMEGALKEIARKLYGVEILVEYVATKEKRRISVEKRDIRSSLEKLGL